jgi:predicted solute-binding protein
MKYIFNQPVQEHTGMADVHDIKAVGETSALTDSSRDHVHTSQHVVITIKISNNTDDTNSLSYELLHLVGLLRIGDDAMVTKRGRKTYTGPVA